VRLADALVEGIRVELVDHGREEVQADERTREEESRQRHGDQLVGTVVAHREVVLEEEFLVGEDTVRQQHEGLLEVDMLAGLRRGCHKLEARLHVG
jgi:hypothetical protein